MPARQASQGKRQSAASAPANPFALLGDDDDEEGASSGFDASAACGGAAGAAAAAAAAEDDGDDEMVEAVQGCELSDYSPCVDDVQEFNTVIKP